MTVIQYKNIAYEVEAVLGDWSIRWNIGSIRHEMKIVGFIPNVPAGYIEVIYNYNRYDLTTDSLLSTEKVQYLETGFANFYYAVVPYEVGKFIATQCLNGLSRRHKFFDGSVKNMEGAMFFDAMAQPRQPVSYSFVVVNAIDQISFTEGEEPQEIHTIQPGSITVNAIDGLGPFTYSIISAAEPNPFTANPEPQSSNVFEALAPGQYVVKMTDSRGEFRRQLITVAVTTI